MRPRTRLVVLDDAAGAPGIDVDAVDLSGEVEPVPEREAALQLRRGAVRAEGDLELARDEGQVRLGLVADEALEIGEKRVPELRALERGQLEPHAGLEGLVQATAQETERGLDVLR